LQEKLWLGQNKSSPPLVTIGIPTFNRPTLLRRTLNSVANQDYSNLEVLVSDNGTEGTENEKILKLFENKIPNLIYHKSLKNMGGLANFEKLLRLGQGHFFMFLADDDEISPNYVSSLVKTLTNNPSCATASANWDLVLKSGVRKRVKNKSFPQKSKFLRVSSFIWHSDDAFFYGLHRREVLQNISLRRTYWSFIKDIDTYKAYLISFELVLNGEVIQTQDSSVVWINHDYGIKHNGMLLRKENNLFLVLIKKIALRLNVHYLYLRQIKISMGISSLIIFVPITIFSILREIIITNIKIFYRLVKGNKDL
jgi:glycosyltransferase involved in cell wall biosynthesis